MCTNPNIMMTRVVAQIQNLITCITHESGNILDFVICCYSVSIKVFHHTLLSWGPTWTRRKDNAVLYKLVVDLMTFLKFRIWATKLDKELWNSRNVIFWLRTPMFSHGPPILRSRWSARRGTMYSSMRRWWTFWAWYKMLRNKTFESAYLGILWGFSSNFTILGSTWTERRSRRWTSTSRWWTSWK